MDLLYLLHSLLRKKWIIIFATLVGLGAGIAFSLNIRKTYTALAQYSTGFTIGQRVKIAGDESINIFEVDFKFKNVMETFNSTTVMGMVSYELLLHDLNEKPPFRVLTAEQKANKNYKQIDPAKATRILRQKIVEMKTLNTYNPDEKDLYQLLQMYGYDHNSLDKTLLIERVGQSDYLNIWFKSENPELSAFVVNELGTAFERFYTNLYNRRSSESSAKLDSLTQAKQKEVMQLTKDFEDFKKNQSSPDIKGTAVAAMDMVNELNNKYADEQAKLNGLRQQLASVNTQLISLPTPSISNSNNAEKLSLIQENRELASQIAERGGNAPELEARRNRNLQRINELTPSTGGKSPAKIQEERDNLTTKKLGLEADIRAAEQNVSLYKIRLGAAQATASQGGGYDVQEASYEAQVKQANDELSYLKNSQQRAQDVSVAPDINFKQTLLAQPPLQPDPSKKMMIIAASGFAMFMLSTILIVLLDLIDGSLKTPSVFLRNTRLKLLSSLNKVNLRKKDVNTLFDPNNFTNATNDEDLFIENIRKLRYEIESSGRKIFLFTSNRPKEGKTTVMEALSNSLSLSKKRVLLIDSNFSNNTLTRKFNAKESLQQFSVNGEKNMLDKFWAITSITNIPNVDIVGCNEGPFTPSEVLPKNNLLENLREISDQYDYILIEGAALNKHADSKELSKYVEGIVSVFSANSVIRQSDKDSIYFLRNTGNKYVGAVLNGLEAENIDL